MRLNSVVSLVLGWAVTCQSSEIIKRYTCKAKSSGSKLIQEDCTSFPNSELTKIVQPNKLRSVLLSNQNQDVVWQTTLLKDYLWGGLKSIEDLSKLSDEEIKLHPITAFLQKNIGNLPLIINYMDKHVEAIPCGANTFNILLEYVSDHHLEPVSKIFLKFARVINTILPESDYETLEDFIRDFSCKSKIQIPNHIYHNLLRSLYAYHNYPLNKGRFVKDVPGQKS